MALLSILSCAAVSALGTRVSPPLSLTARKPRVSSLPLPESRMHAASSPHRLRTPLPAAAQPPADRRGCDVVSLKVEGVASHGYAVDTVRQEQNRSRVRFESHRRVVRPDLD
jgi:hypothetical protein